MNLTKMMEGKRVELPAMLEARERRAFLQMQLIRRYKKALISFTLNIAGPVKVFPLSVRTFEEGLRLIRICCGEYGIPVLHEEILREYTGFEAFLSVDADPSYVKKVLTSLEDDHSLGRLFDIDIIRPDLSKVSRKELGKEERRCLICGGPAFVCSGRRLHRVEELQERTVQIMWDYFAFRFADDTAMTACRALLYEVMATPKPGLVDRDNTGAHDDMDIFTFETSALALLPYFRRFVSYGIEQAGKEARDLLAGIRPVGREADLAMLRATGGINTHKGAVFSVGILCPVMKELTDLKESREGERKLTHGEELYLKYGIGGVRMETALGYPALFETALPELRRLVSLGFSLNDAGVLTLMKILSETDDTSLISRCGYEKACAYRKKAGELTAEGLEGMDYERILRDLDREMIRDHASPGGSADLLAMTYFLYFMETGTVPSTVK